MWLRWKEQDVFLVHVAMRNELFVYGNGYVRVPLVLRVFITYVAKAAFLFASTRFQTILIPAIAMYIIFCLNVIF